MRLYYIQVIFKLPHARFSLARSLKKKKLKRFFLHPKGAFYPQPTSHNIYIYTYLHFFREEEEKSYHITAIARARARRYILSRPRIIQRKNNALRSRVLVLVLLSHFFESKITCEKIAVLLTATTATARRRSVGINNVPKKESATKKTMPTREGKANATSRTRFCTRSRSSPTRTRARFFLSSLARAV